MGLDELREAAREGIDPDPPKAAMELPYDSSVRRCVITMASGSDSLKVTYTVRTT